MKFRMPTVLTFRRSTPNPVRVGHVPSPVEVAAKLAETLAGLSGDGWYVDTATSSHTSQVVLFGTVDGDDRSFLVPVTVGPPTVLNAAGTTVCEDTHPPRTGDGDMVGDQVWGVR